MLNRRAILSSSALVLAGLSAARATAAKPDLSVAGAIPPSQSAHDWTVPRPMFWSFDNRDPVIEAAGLKLSFQIMTHGPIENNFSLDASSIKVSQSGNDWVIEAARLSWPGQQKPAEGTLRAELTVEGDLISVSLTATAMENVRLIKMSLHGLAETEFYHTGWQVTANGAPVTSEGVTSNYPSYTGGMPVWFLGREGKGMSFSSLDLTPMPKRCGATLHNGRTTIDLFVEQNARKLAKEFNAPVWEIRRNTSLMQAIDARCQRLEANGLKRWEDRSDVPAWAHDIDLVVTLHGMHWSGYIFNDYAQMLKAALWVMDHIEGRRVLFFLAGWEGRYYRTYGASAADGNMGGAAGLKALVNGIHARGGRVMAMFAGNATDDRLPEFASYGPNSGFNSLPGPIDWSPMNGYQVDWAEIRGGVTGGRWLNPGAPDWRNHLIKQVGDLNDTYGFDGNFFDTQPNINNDYNFDPLNGLALLSAGLRQRKPDLLLATETWYDLSLSFMPMSQTPDGPGGWSDRYQHRFAHLALAEPSRGSTGVHELGFVDYDAADLLKSFTLPTLGFVEDTYSNAPDKVLATISAAKARDHVITAF